MLKRYICRSNTGGLLVALKQNKVMCCRSLICQENGAADVRSTSGTGCAFDCEGIHAGQSLQEECHYLWNSVSFFFDVASGLTSTSEIFFFPQANLIVNTVST